MRERIHSILRQVCHENNYLNQLSAAINTGKLVPTALHCICVKTDAIVADHMEHWVHAQHARLRQPQRQLPVQIPPIAPAQPDDPWEAAIAEAREQMRELIECGDLDHDETTAPWIEQWAADIYRERMTG